MVKSVGSRGSGSRSGRGNTSACGHALPLILPLAKVTTTHAALLCYAVLCDMVVAALLALRSGRCAASALRAST